MKTLLDKAQKIIDSYKGVPNESLIVRASMINEVANLIVDHMMSKQEDLESFDFRAFFEQLKMPEDL